MPRRCGPCGWGAATMPRSAAGNPTQAVLAAGVGVAPGARRKAVCAAQMQAQARYPEQLFAKHADRVVTSAGRKPVWQYLRAPGGQCWARLAGARAYQRITEAQYVEALARVWGLEGVGCWLRG